MNELAKKKCAPCEGGTALKGAALRPLQEKLGGSWKVVNEHHLERELKFKDFKQALDFTDRVGAVAEREGHHPDLELGWGRVKVMLWTHSAGGLTENDFIVAAKIDEEAK